MGDNISEIIQNLVIRVGNLADENIVFKEGMSLVNDLKYDSVSIINLIVAIEQEFDIEFDDEEMLIGKVDDLDELIKYVCELV